MGHLHLLFWLSLLRFACRWMGENHFAPLSVALYGVVLLIAGFAYWLLARAIIRAYGPGSLLAQAIGSDRKGNASVVLCLVAIPLTFVHVALAEAIYVGAALMWLFPDRRIEQVRSGAGH